MSQVLGKTVSLGIEATWAPCLKAPAAPETEAKKAAKRNIVALTSTVNSCLKPTHTDRLANLEKIHNWKDGR